MMTGCLSLKEPGEGNADPKTQGSAGCPAVWGVDVRAPGLGPHLTDPGPEAGGGGGGAGRVMHFSLTSVRGRGGAGWGAVVWCGPLNCHIASASFQLPLGPRVCSACPLFLPLHSSPAWGEHCLPSSFHHRAPLSVRRTPGSFQHPLCKSSFSKPAVSLGSWTPLGAPEQQAGPASLGVQAVVRAGRDWLPGPHTLHP